jgi:hypothetical protein
MTVLLINVAHCMKYEKTFYSYDTEITVDATCAKLLRATLPLNF